jgi:hypothetical protein
MIVFMGPAMQHPEGSFLSHCFRRLAVPERLLVRGMNEQFSKLPNSHHSLAQPSVSCRYTYLIEAFLVR